MAVELLAAVFLLLCFFAVFFAVVLVEEELDACGPGSGAANRAHAPTREAKMSFFTLILLCEGSLISASQYHLAVAVQIQR